MDRQPKWNNLRLKNWTDEKHATLCAARLEMIQEISELKKASYLQSVTARGGTDRIYLCVQT